MMTGNELLKEIVRYDKYARYLPHANRRETWEETTDRVIEFFTDELNKQNRKLDEQVWKRLRKAMLDKQVLPSMRAVQMAGPAAARDHTHLYNCSYLPLDGPEALRELLYILMCGTGVGYSVELQHVIEWRSPKHYTHSGTVDDKDHIPYIIEDSSLGWADAFYRAIDMSLDAVKPKFDYSRIRPYGSPLATKGGRASGPEPLRKLLDGTWDIISDRKGEALRSIDIHRLACLAGSIVDVGGVRRAALIALFSAEDGDMLNCKTGDWFSKYPELAKANNSMVASHSDLNTIIDTLAKDGYGEPGIFNRHQDGMRVLGVEYGTNPCGEIILEPHQFCNLSIAVARPDDDFGSLKEKVHLATVWGTIQSCMTYFPNLRPEWSKNCERERLLGVDITGTQDCPLLSSSNLNDLPTILEDLSRVAHETNRKYAHKLGINQSAAITCNKPSGNSSQLLDCSSGIHARWAPYYLRRLRLDSGSELANTLIAQGVPHVYEGTNAIVEIPVKSPSPLSKDDMSALEQLEYWRAWKLWWCDHNPSSTIYVKPDEWESVLSWLSVWWPIVGGLSFLPKDDHKYENAPYESISEEDFLAREKAIENVTIDLGKMVEVVDDTTLSRDAACLGGMCVWE
jgi:ribonucleoside-diphosphate reductase alpha chain